MITTSKAILTIQSSFIINIGILVCLNLLYITAFASLRLTNIETSIVIATNVILMVISLIIHDMGHIIGALVSRITIRRIILSCSGGIIHFDKKRDNDPSRVIFSLILGPLTNIIIGIFLLLFWYYHNQYAFNVFPIKETIENSLMLIAGYNLVIGFINLIPVNPFDGGNIIYYVSKYKFRDQSLKIDVVFHYWHKIFFTLSMVFIIYLVIIYLQYSLLIILIYLILIYNDSKSKELAM